MKPNFTIIRAGGVYYVSLQAGRFNLVLTNRSYTRARDAKRGALRALAALRGGISPGQAMVWRASGYTPQSISRGKA